jgi:hypothetical protein
MYLYEIYVEGDPYDTVWADSAEEAVEYFKMDYPNIKRPISAYELLDEDE